MDPKELFRQAILQAEHCLRHVNDDQLATSTPCKEWDLRDLLHHMVYELMWVPELVDGKTIAEVGDRFDGDVLGKDVQAAWDRASHGALAAVESADLQKTAHLSYADVPMSNYISEMAGDILIHGWDAGQSIKCNIILESEVVQAVYDNTLPRKKEFAESELFGTPFDVPDSASLQTKLLALVGRKAA